MWAKQNRKVFYPQRYWEKMTTEGLVWIFESNFVFAEFSTIAKKYKNVAK
jgi:hypothetical protein